MPLIRREPVKELGTNQTTINRLFQTVFDAPVWSADTELPRGWLPAMDLVETEDRYVLHVDLPGLSEEDVAIQLEGNVVCISGARTMEPGQHGRHRERSFGSFSRSLILPDGADPDGIEARSERGVLEVMIPKAKQNEPGMVRINPGGSLSPDAVRGSVSQASELVGDRRHHWAG